MHQFSNQSINPSIRPSIYPSDLASIIPSSHTGSHARRQGRTHARTCKSTHLFILCPSRPSIARIPTRTFRHAHIYAYIHAYSTGPVAQLAARQVCNLSSPGVVISMSSQIAFVEIGHKELVSTAILSLPLNQGRQLSLTGESMCCLYW